jgi:hypothetical protein
VNSRTLPPFIVRARTDHPDSLVALVAMRCNSIDKDNKIGMASAHAGVGLPAPMIAERDGVEALFEAFRLLGTLQRLFEGTETKQRLRRAGLETKPRALCSPFVANAFFGNVVLTSAWLSDDTAGEARCAFYSGVVVHALSDCVAPRLPGRPELQVGLAFSGASESWTQEDESELEALQAALGPAWSVEHRTARHRKSICLAAREDALHLIGRLNGDRLGLLRARDEFFLMRWADLGDAPATAYDWLKRKV